MLDTLIKVADFFFICFGIHWIYQAGMHERERRYMEWYKDRENDDD